MPGRSHRRSGSSSPLACSPPCRPQRPPGHGAARSRVISRIAEKHLTPKARDAIADLLAPGETFPDASTWADENRRKLPKTAPWHYVDVPLDEARYDTKWSATIRKKAACSTRSTSSGRH